MLIPTNKKEYLEYLDFSQTKEQNLRVIAHLLFDIREILLNQQQNKDENCHFDKIKELTKEM